MFITTRQEKRNREKTLKTIYIFQCDVCHQQFDTIINGKARSKQKNHYCSQVCVKISLKKDGIAQNNMRETCIEKYGVETFYEYMNKTKNKTLAHTKDANEKRASTMISKYGFKTFRKMHSNIELELLDLLKDFKFKSGFVGRNQVDLLCKEKKIAIEVQGDFWHANPRKYPENWINPVSNLIMNEIHEKDKNKKIFLESKGYTVLYIWEMDYKENKEETLEKVVRDILQVSLPPIPLTV